MNIKQVGDILDLAWNINQEGKTFNVLFSGPAGVGKSERVQQWCKQNNLPFIDLRAAYLEAPDVIGFPSVEVIDGRQVTKHNLPEFWPVGGKGVLLLEEPNRGTTSVLNTFMQLLTDRKIHTYHLPKDWMIVGLINPETAEYDVNTMDAALKNRFEIFEVGYDKTTFVNYMKTTNYNKQIINFVEYNMWEYKTPEDLADNPGSKYVSPRSFSKLNNALNAGISKELELTVFEAVLGKNVGKSFWAFVNDERPVRLEELLKDTKAALKTLKKYSEPSNYKNALLSITIKDIVDNEQANKEGITDELLKDIMLAIPSDQGMTLVRDIEYKRKDKVLDRLIQTYPKIKEEYSTVLKRK